MVLDSKTISNSLISEGYPIDWNETDVKKIGLTDGNYRLNQTKLNRFANMNYPNVRSSIFDSRFNYYFQLKDKEGNVIPINGSDGIGAEVNSSIRVVQISRVAIYNSSITRMVLKLW